MMRVVLISTMYLPAIGGAELALSNLCAELEKQGVSYILVIPFKNWRLLREKKSDGQPKSIIPLFPGYQFCTRISITLGYYLLALQLNLIQFWFRATCWHAVGAFPTGVMVARWSRTRGFGVLVRCPGEDIQVDEQLKYGVRLDPKIDAYIRDWLPSADMLVAHSGSIEREYKALKIAEEKIKRIPNGVHLERFQKNSQVAPFRKKITGSSEKPFTFLFVGRNHPKKGLDVLIKAACLIQDRGEHKVKLNLIGRGVEDLAKVVERYNLSSAISLIPQLNEEGDNPLHPSENLLGYFLSADAFVLPSYVESFGIVLLEAMAAGLPIITTDAPGCRDVIREGHDGIMVPRGNPAELASAMNSLITDPDLCEQLSERSLIRVKSFDWKKVADDYIRIYEELSRHAEAQNRR